MNWEIHVNIMWISRFPSNICWKNCPHSNVCFWCLCQKLVDKMSSFCMSLFWNFSYCSTDLNVCALYQSCVFVLIPLQWYNIFIDLHMLNSPCMFVMIPPWSWCMIFLMYCWICFPGILLRIFASVLRDIHVQFPFSCVLVWFWF
jgi:hypothetical protein